MSSETVLARSDSSMSGLLYNTLQLITPYKLMAGNVSLEYQELLCVSEQQVCFCLLDTENHIE